MLRAVGIDGSSRNGHERPLFCEMIPRKTVLRTLMLEPTSFLRRYRWPLLILLIGASADVVTTLVNLRQYGPSVEAHVAQRVVDQIVGVDAGVPAAKVIQIALVLLVAAWWEPWCAWLIGACGVLYTLAAISNHFLLL
jgi:hypothetical protein